MTSGPDVPTIQCYEPDGCCGPSPCAITQEQFICQLRALLPEGDLYNNSLPTQSDLPQVSYGANTVGCAKVGCEQLVFGACCPDMLECDPTPIAPQLALADAFAAVAYQAVQSLCQMLRELDPCTADLTLRRWAARFGINYPDPCAGQWSDEVLGTLICVMLQIRLHVINWSFLETLAARFGATLTLHHAGDFNCGPAGWWTMARDATACPVGQTCPPADPAATATSGQLMRLTPTCVGVPVSLNLVLAPGDIVFPPNCNVPPVPATLPHDPELYEALKWLLPRILPQPAFWCVYERDDANCIV